MWPKALVQLLELAPHVTRLVPMADRYLQSKAEGRDASRRAMEQLCGQLRDDVGQITGGMRGELGQMAAAQAGVYHQLNEQRETLATMASDLRLIRSGQDEMETRMARIEKRASRMGIAIGVCMFLLTAAVVGLIVVISVVYLHRLFHGS